MLSGDLSTVGTFPMIVANPALGSEASMGAWLSRNLIPQALKLSDSSKKYPGLVNFS
jgi:hypothetical protein